MINSLILLPLKTRLSRLLGKPPKLFSLTLAITYQCQSRCQTCHIWKLYQKNKKAAKKELQARDYQPLFANLQNNLVHLGITGGEPFLKNDLEEIITLAGQNLKKLSYISITTNGLSPEKITNTTKKILKLFPGNLSLEISLDGEQKLHDKIRGLPGSYKKALETYRQLSYLAKKNPRLHVFFSYTISTLNVGQFNNFFQKLPKDLSINIKSISFNLEHQGFLYHKKGNLNHNKNFQKTLEKDINFILKKSSSSFTTNFFRLSKSAFKKFYLKNLLRFAKNPQKMILPCASGTYSYFIDPYGDIYPCIIWPQKLGNLKTIDWQKFWSAKNLKKIRQEIKKEKCPICFTPCEAQISFLCHIPFSLASTIPKFP